MHAIEWEKGWVKPSSASGTWENESRLPLQIHIMGRGRGGIRDEWGLFLLCCNVQSNSYSFRYHVNIENVGSLSDHHSGTINSYDFVFYQIKICTLYQYLLVSTSISCFLVYLNLNSSKSIYPSLRNAISKPAFGALSNGELVLSL
jgi:hypothetical protein